jgi:hypothetical protein
MTSLSLQRSHSNKCSDNPLHTCAQHVTLESGHNKKGSYVKNQRTWVQLTPDAYAELEKLAEVRGLTPPLYVRILVMDHLAKKRAVSQTQS